jgi:predicted HicB family RNase H-like nuclease
MTTAVLEARGQGTGDRGQEGAEPHSGYFATFNERCEFARRQAEELFALAPEWPTFFRETVGAQGLVAKLFPTFAEREVFNRSTAAFAIQGMLRELRERGLAAEQEPTRVITVRLPKSLHESLRAEAHERDTSLNQLCISKLLLELGSKSGDDAHA